MFRRKSAFSFVLKESFRETSKDSHSYTTTYSLNEGKLHRDHVYKGFPDDQEEHEQLKANGSTIDAIRAKIEAQSLLTRYTKQFPANSGGGVRASIGMQLTIQDGTEAYSISVSGNPPEVRADEMYRKLSVLYSFIYGFFQK